MADTKVSQLPSLATITGDDLLLAVDSPGGGASTRKITVSNFLSSALGLTTTDALPEGSTNKYGRWTDDGAGIKRGSHIAVGSGASVDTIPPAMTAILPNTLNSTINNYNAITTPSNVNTAILNTLLVDSSTSTGDTYAGQDGLVQVKSGNASNYTGAMYGDAGSVYHYGSGTITTGAGVLGQIRLDGPGAYTSAIALYGLGLHTGSGTIGSVAGAYVRHILWPGNTVNITNQYGIQIDSPIKLGGNITNNYGLYITDQGTAATNNYNLYSAGATANNYIAGTLAIDTQSGHTLSSSTQSLIQTLVDEQNSSADAMYISPSPNGGGRLYIGKSGRGIYAMNFKYVSNLEQLPRTLSSAGGDDAYIMRSGGNGFIMTNSTNGGDAVFGLNGGGFLTGTQNTTATGWRRWIQWKSYAADADTNQGTPPANYIYDTASANTTTSHTKLRQNGTDILSVGADGQVNLLPVDATYTAGKTAQKLGNTYTVNFTNATAPVGYEFSPSVIFQQNGNAFGSGIGFYMHPLFQNDSGSTRTMGPYAGFVAQPTYQANGGTLSGQAIDFVSSATFSHINAGVTNFSNHYHYWMQGGSISAGDTLTNRFGLYYNPTGTINGTLTNEAAFVSSGLQATNKTHILLGTTTIPTGNYAIYSADTNPEFFSGDVQFAKEVARTIGIQDTTTAATAGAALTILGAKGSNTTSGAGGAINITGGAAQAGNSVGGGIVLTGGAAAGAAGGGSVTIRGGAGFVGGNILLDIGGGFAGASLKIGSVNATPIAIGNITPTAYLHFKAGVAAANGAPLKFTTGTNLTTAEAGAFEYNNTLYFTQSDATRRNVVLAASATKTIAGAPYANDGYITVRIGGTDVKLMTTA